MDRPELPKGQQPGIQLLQRFGSQPVQPALGIHRGLDETGFPEHPKVLGDRRLGQAEFFPQLPDGPLRGRQQVQDGPPVRFCNDRKKSFHVSSMHSCVHTCQCI